MHAGSPSLPTYINGRLRGSVNGPTKMVDCCAEQQTEPRTTAPVQLLHTQNVRQRARIQTHSMESKSNRIKPWPESCVFMCVNAQREREKENQTVSGSFVCFVHQLCRLLVPSAVGRQPLFDTQCSQKAVWPVATLFQPHTGATLGFQLRSEHNSALLRNLVGLHRRSAIQNWHMN